MSVELQNESLEPVENETETQEIENLQEEGSELAPDSETQHEQQAEVDEEAAKQAAIQKVINEKTFKAKQAEREAQELKAKLEAIEAKEREEFARQVENIPPMPDPFDDDFEEKIKARDDAILKKASYDAQNQYYAQQQQIQQQQEQAKQQQDIQQKWQNYTSKAADLGIKQEEVKSAIDTVAQYGIDDNLTLAILQDPDGPLITEYLAANPNEINELNGNPYIAGAKLVEIKQKASQLKPKKTSAPEPATRVKGSTVNQDAGRFKHSKGAKFE